MNFNKFYAVSDEVADCQIHFTRRELLAIGAVLRVVDDEMLEDAGLLPGVVETVNSAFDVVDDALTTMLGDDWPALTVPQSVLDEEYEPDALWGEEDTGEDA